MSNHLPTRRDALRVGCVAAAASTAGCLGAFGSDGEDDARRTLRLSLSHLGGTLRDRRVIDPTETRSEVDGPAIRAAVEGSSYTTQNRKPFFSTAEDPEYARHDGTYYRLGSVVVGEATETHPVLRLRATDRDADADAVAAERLPDGDRAAVRVAHMAARARGNEGGVPWGLVQRGGYVYRSDEATEASRLLADDGPSAVTYRGTAHDVDVDRERFHEPIYRATADPVASDPEGMEAVLRAALVDARVARDDLSAAARDVMRSARGEGYGERHPYSAEYRTVLRSLHERAYLDGNVEKDAFGDAEHGRGRILYGGEYYDYRLRFDPASGA